MSVSVSLGEQKILDLPQGAISYRERGRGEPLLLLGGLMVNGDTFRNVVPILARRFRCITPDLPLGAHTHPMPRRADLSMPALADLAVAILDALEVERATVIGNDAGGVVAQLMVARHPDRVANLVLACCDAYEDFPPRDFKSITLLPYIPGSLLLVALLLLAKPFRRSRMGQGAVMRQDPPPEVTASYLRPALRRAIRRDLAAVLRAVDVKHTLGAARSFGSYRRPVLVAWGEDERLFDPSIPARLAAAFPNATLVRVPRSLTYIPEDEPAELAATIERFLDAASTSPRSQRPETSGATS